MFLLYNLLWFVSLPCLLLLLPPASLLAGKKRSGLLQRLGMVSMAGRRNGGKKIIWIQALSVGEIATARPIVDALRAAVDHCGFVISVTTEAGFEQAKQSFPDALKIFYAPLDFYPSVAGLIKKIRPAVLLIIETGFWPNLIRCGRGSGALTVLVNGRISEKSYRRYKALAPFSRALFNRFHFLITRDEEVSRKFKGLGVAEGKIDSFGDLKYDTLLKSSQVNRARLRGGLAIQEETRLIIAGNTHEREEEFILDIFDALQGSFKNILLVVAPRRLERLPEIEKMLKERGRSYAKRTSLKEGCPAGTTDLILLDTIGELSKIYFIADIVFVGNSIYPPGGGHSLLEPVAAGKLAFHGPHVQYYEEASNLLAEAGLAVELGDRASYIEHFSRILADEGDRGELAARTEDFLRKRRGASKKTAQWIKAGLERMQRNAPHDPASAGFFRENP